MWPELPFRADIYIYIYTIFINTLTVSFKNRFIILLSSLSLSFSIFWGNKNRERERRRGRESRVWIKMGEYRGDESVRRRGCSCAKDDFLPDESFRSWGNYVRALKDTPHRLKDRVLTRSSDETELVDVKAQSQHEMKKSLTWWDLMWFGIGAVIGAGIFVLTGLEAREHAGPAVVLSYAISGFSALLSVFCYTEFGVEIPSAGTYHPSFFF